MNDRGAELKADEQVLRATIDGADELVANYGFEGCGNRPTQAPVAHDHIDDAVADESGCNARSGSFDFRKLGQRLRRII
jgi:hypothetical protein